MITVARALTNSTFSLQNEDACFSETKIGFKSYGPKNTILHN
uniref:Uncharacterized protein n=1 Tax=Anguilla anguilla TaxID=7936 RepID=A0A0E9TEB1_ANGAN